MDNSHFLTQIIKIYSQSLSLITRIMFTASTKIFLNETIFLSLQLSGNEEEIGYTVDCIVWCLNSFQGAGSFTHRFFCAIEQTSKH